MSKSTTVSSSVIAAVVAGASAGVSGVSALLAEPGPRLRPIANRCTASSCPTVYLDADSGTLVVQGFDVSPEQEGVEVPEGESLVRVPIELLVEAMNSLA